MVLIAALFQETVGVSQKRLNQGVATFRQLNTDVDYSCDDTHFAPVNGGWRTGPYYFCPAPLRGHLNKLVYPWFD